MMSIDGFHAALLLVIGATWLLGWLVGRGWVKSCGVRESVSAWALACIVPTAGLLLAVHAMAFVSLLLDKGYVTPVTVAIAFAALMWATSAFVKTQHPPAPKTIRPRIAAPVRSSLRGWWIPVLIVAGMYFVFFVDALTGYPTGHDALHYHLPNAVRWMQERSIHMVVGVPAQCVHENGMIVPFLLSFARAERLFPIVHLPKALLVAATIYGLARYVGVRSLAATVAACVALSVPMVVFQSFSAYVDLYAAASWLSAVLAVAWAMRATHPRQRRNLLILAGLSAGVALGAKTTYLIMTALLVAVILAERWIRPQEGRTLAPAPARNVGIFCAGVLGCTAFWFTLGTVEAGNPIYPVPVTIGEWQVLPGIDFYAKFPKRSAGRKLARWWDYPWREPKHSGMGPNPGYPYSRNNALGAAYAAFVPLGLLAAGLAAVQRRTRTQEERWRVILLLNAATALLLIPTVFLEMLRYALPQILVAIPVAAILIDRLMTRFPRSMLVTATAALAVTAAIATLKPAHALASRIKEQRWDRAWFYQVPPVIDELEPGARVLNLSAPSATYSLLGRDLANRVITPIHWGVLTGDGPPTAEALHTHGIDYIFVHAPWPTDWPDDLPVTLIYDNHVTRLADAAVAARVYRVEPASLGGGPPKPRLTHR